jgi:hypothetical protein
MALPLGTGTQFALRVHGTGGGGGGGWGGETSSSGGFDAMAIATANRAQGVPGMAEAGRRR